MPAKQNKNTEEPNRELVNRVPEYLNKGDISVLEDVYSEDLVGYSSDSTEYGLVDLVQGFEAMLDAFPDFEIKVEDQIAENDVVYTTYTMSGTHESVYKTEKIEIPATGKRFEIPGIIMHRTEDGKIVEEKGARDNLVFFQQLGVISENLNEYAK